CWLREPQMPERMPGEQTSARRALQKTLLNEKRLDDLLERVARLGERRRHGVDPDRAAAIVERDGGEIAPVHGIAAGGIDFARKQCLVGHLAVDRGRACHMREVADAL